MKLPTLTQSINISDGIHSLLNFGLPLLSVVLVFFDLTPLALIAVLLSKWRIFAVKPFYWFVNLRASAIDIIVGISSVLLISESYRTIQADSEQLYGYVWAVIWTALYMAWLFLIKPRTSLFAREVQTLWAVVVGSWTLTIFSQDLSTISMVLYFWLIGLASARHFLASREERFVNGLSFIWGAIFVQLGWILSQWIHIYSVDGLFEIPQSSILLGLASFASMKAYREYRMPNPKLSNVRTLLISSLLIAVIALASTDWGGI